jgi:PIN domain nuclease of toxin-antitoxin system
MKVLLDTCTFLWVILDEDRLSPRARQVFSDPTNDVLLSSASAWEISVKHAIGKLSLPASPADYVRKKRIVHGIDPLALTEDDALFGASLPLLHRDPFDRMLVCQAIVHGLTILTPDPLIRQYSATTDW